MKRLALAIALTLLAAPVGATIFKPDLYISGAWSRPAPQGGNGAGYATFSNSTAKADQLVSASSPVAQRVEIHETMIMSGKAMMHPRPGGLTIPAAGVAALKPGGWHLMLIGLKKPLKAGERFPVTLVFETAGKRQVEFVVATAPPPAPPPTH